MGVEEKLRYIEGLKEQLCCFDSVADRVVWWLSEKDGMLLRVDFEVFEDIAPYCFHLFPVLNDSMFNRIIQLNQTFKFLLLMHIC